MDKLLISLLIISLFSTCSAQNGFCDSEPCLNNGGCVEFFDVSYLCFCTQQFTGRNCETPLTPCSSSPCQNGATCEVFLGVSYFCVCAEGFTGETCSDAISTIPPPTTLFQKLSTLLSTTVSGATSGSGEDICGTVVTSRIVGGRDASLGRYPWQGYLVAKNVLCGCSLIDNEWAVTAAHCLDATSQVYLDGVAFGTINLDAPGNSTVFTTVERIIVHPGYNAHTFENDIALLHFTNPISYSVNVRPICLETSLSETTLYENCDASGFGSTSYGSPAEPMLQEVEITLFAKDQCNNLDVTENQLCAGGNGKGICPGDSGGPLACQRTDGRFSLVGVSSFFNPVNDSCGEFSSGFARVSKYNDFLRSALSNQDPAVSCETVEMDVCTQVLPYSLTYSTSQEDLFPQVESFRNATRYDQCHPDGTLLACALFFHECSEDSTQDQDRLCRQICLDVLQACNLTYISSLCSMFPIGATPDQKWCPSGPDPICNQHFDLQSEPVLLRSPNFPEEYNNTLNCEWTASAPQGYNIIAKIRSFTTEEGYDFILIGSGPDPSNRSTAFIRESGSLPPGSRLFPTNELWINFASDGGVVSPGFEIELFAVNEETECLNGFLLCSVENICIPSSWQCDGVADCINEDDEMFCDAECVSTISGFCQNLPYSEVNFAGSEVRDDSEAQAVFNILEGFVATCPGEDRLFLCALLYPECPSGTGYFPCRETCEMVMFSCPTLIFAANLNCSQLPSGVPQGNGVCLPGASTEMPTSSGIMTRISTNVPGMTTNLHSTVTAAETETPGIASTQSTATASTIPPNVIPVDGLCENYLEYEFAQADTKFEMPVQLSPKDASESIINSGLCESIPAMCSLFYPPLASSNVTLCREACSLVFKNCEIAVPFFINFNSRSCTEFPLKGNSGSYTCIEGKMNSTTAATFTAQTTRGVSTASTLGVHISAATSQTPVVQTTEAPPSSIPVTGVCSEYLDYQFAEPMPLLEMVVDISPEIPTTSVVNSGLCAEELLPAMCSLFFPPLLSSNMTLCQETCGQIFQDCDIALAFFIETTPSVCIDLPRRTESDNFTCIEGEIIKTTIGASTARTTHSSKSPVTTQETTTPVTTMKETTKATSQAPTSSIPVTGVCSEYLDYQFAEPKPLLELVVDISPEISTTSVVDSGLCAEELLPAMCSLFFPPLLFSNMTLCQETCGQIFQDCDIALAFFRESNIMFCADLPKRTDSGNFTCIGDKISTTTASASTASTRPLFTSQVTTLETTTPVTTMKETTKATSQVPPSPVPVTGVCAEYLDYEFAQPMPLLELAVDISAEIATVSVVNSGLCPHELLPAMCSLFFPPLLSSNMTLCQERCSQIFQDCGIALAFFRETLPSICTDFPQKTDSGNLTCIGDEVDPTTTITSTTSTTKMSSAPVTTVETLPTTPSATTSQAPPTSVLVTGVCTGYLNYQFAEPMPLFELVVDVSQDIPAMSVVNSGLCAEELLPAMCSLFFPPLNSSRTTLCREDCNQIFQDCSIALAFFRGFPQSTCMDLPPSAKSGNLACVGEEITTTTFSITTTRTAEMSSSPATTQGTTSASSETTKATSQAPSPTPEGSRVVGPCQDYLEYQFSQPQPLFEVVLGLTPLLSTTSIFNSDLCEDSLSAMCSLFFPPLPISNYTLCRETCNQIFIDCQVAVAFLVDFSPIDCLLFPLSADADANCIGDEGMSTTTVATTQTTPGKTSVVTTSGGSSEQTSQVPSTLAETTDAPTTSFSSTTVVPTPMKTTEQDETATTLGQSSTPTTFGPTSPTTILETSPPMTSSETTELTPSVTTKPSDLIPVVGICEAFLPYRFAQPEPVLDLVIGISLDAITATVLNSGLCDVDLLPAMCSLFFPPPPSSNFVLCRDTCRGIFVNCRAAVAFFRDATEVFCLGTPIRTEVEGAACIGDGILTTEETPSLSTKFGTTVSPTTSMYTSLPTPSAATSPASGVPVVGVCQEYLKYDLAEPETLYELVTTLPIDAATRSIEGQGQCEEVMPAVCSLFFPPLPSSGRVLCRESCRQIFTNCQVAVIFFSDFTQQSCSKFPKRANTGDNVCVGDEVPTTLLPEPSTEPTSPIIIVDYLCDLFGCENGGTCSDNDQGGRECVCPPGFGGELCEEFPCERRGCQNGGLCFPNNVGERVCFCPADYSGEFCELTLTPAPTTPVVSSTTPEDDFPCDIFGCENGGLCFPNQNDIKVCFCPADYSGEFCEISLKTTPSPTLPPTTAPMTTEPPVLTTIAPCTPDELQSVQGICQEALSYDEALLEPNFPLLRDDFSLMNIISIITTNSLCAPDLIAGMCYLFYPPCPTSDLYLCPETCRALFRSTNGCSVITTFLEISEEDCSNFQEGQDVGNGLCVKKGPTTPRPTTTERVTSTQQSRTTIPLETSVVTTTSTTRLPTTEAARSTLPTDTTRPDETSSPTSFTPGVTTTASECYFVPVFCRDVITYEMTSVRPDQNKEKMFQQFQIIFACHVDMKLYACAYLYPPCEPLQSRSLCMERCTEVEDSCGNTNLFGKLDFNCNEFTDAAKGPDGLCRAGFLGSTSEAATTTIELTTFGELSTQRITPQPTMCTPVHPRCLEVLPYSLGVSTISELVVDNFLDLHFGFPSSCDERYRKLLCSDLYKPCPGSGFGVGFCSDVCEDVERSCQVLFAFFPTLSFPVDCDTLPNSIFDEDLYDEYGLCN